VTTILGGRLSLVPVLSGLLSLFSGGSSKESSTLSKYEAPSSLAFSLGFSEKAGGKLSTLDYGGSGVPRLADALSGSEGDTGALGNASSVLDYATL
jgi:hypothetical protein